VDTNIFQMTINSRSIVFDAISTIDDIIEIRHAIYVKSLFLSLSNDGGRYTFDT
jgi:hypothetical protein